MNTEKLRLAINRSGLKHKHIADELGISENLFAQKLLGNTSIKIDESKKMKCILNLTNEEFMSIFFD